MGWEGPVPGASLSESLDEILVEFVSEAREDLAAAELALLAREAGAAEVAPINLTFHAMHTLKGNAGFLGFQDLQSLAHAAETVLTLLQERRLALTSKTTSLLLGCIDALRLHLDCVSAGMPRSLDADRSIIDALAVLETASQEAPRSPSRSAGPRFDPDATFDGSVVGDVSPLVETEAGLDTRPEQRDPSRLRPGRPADGFVRVEVSVLDRLFDQAGELVVVRNRLLRAAAQSGDPDLRHSVQQLDRQTTELNDCVNRARLVPFQALYGRLARQVRELGRATGKAVRLETNGMETDVDRALLDALRAPLVHLVRNAIDHGIESPEARTGLGKPTHGTIRLETISFAGDLHIALSDDGKGISRHALRARAAEAGLLTEDALQGASDSVLLSLIFQPGFSTAMGLSDVSGRGMGMDIVRKRVEEIGGDVAVESVEGQGTTVRLRLPASLTVVPAVVVTSGNQRFGIPAAGVVDILQVRQHELSALHGNAEGPAVLSYRKQPLPLVSLRGFLELGNSSEAQQDRYPVFILKTGSHCFALLVDAADDGATDLVSKPLGPMFDRQVPFSGVTVLGDGELSLILDLVAIPRLAALGPSPCPRQLFPGDAWGKAQRRLMVFETAVGLLAVPLARVVRILQVTSADVKATKHGLWLASDGATLRVLDLDDRAIREGERRTVLVCRSRGRRVGLLVSGAVDLFEGAPRQVLGDAFPRLRGAQSVELDGRLASLIDLERFSGLVSDHASTLS